MYKSTISNYITPENTQVLLSGRFRTHEMHTYHTHTRVEIMLANISSWQDWSRSKLLVIYSRNSREYKVWLLVFIKYCEIWLTKLA
jgi:hypothetical protein